MRAMVTAFTILLAACSNDGGKTEDAGNSSPPAEAQPPRAIAAPALEVMWLAEGFDAPEGVALAPDGAYFISNVGGEENSRDGIGWISKISPDGAIVAARWIEGLDSPLGMAVDNGVLYVADIDRVRTFDATSGAPGAVVAIDGAKLLNDMTVWRGEIYVADSATARIWRLPADGPVLWREGEELDGVNGLLGDGDNLLVTTMTTGSLFEATANGGWRTIATGMRDADGIGIVPEAAGGGYLVSSWPGEVWYVAKDGSTASILNTREAGILQNDLTVLDDIVIIANWEPGTVTAWRLTGQPRKQARLVKI